MSGPELEAGGPELGQSLGEHLGQAHLQCVHVADSSARHDGVCHSFLELPERTGSVKVGRGKGGIK